MKRLLPIYRAGGSDAPRFMGLQSEEREIAAQVAVIPFDELARGQLLSGNAKTSVSLDFPIGHTCDPTALCASVCYASRPGTPARWKKSLRLRLRNLRYFKEAYCHRAVERLTREFRRMQRRWIGRVQLDFLRINGTGDLFPEIIPVLNGFMAQNPDVALWVVSRRPELAELLDPQPNLFLQLSLDGSTTQFGIRSTANLIASNSRAYASFLRTEIGQDTLGSAIVFNEKRTDGLPYDGISDCPVDAGRLGFDNVRGVGGTACSKCRKCFNPKTLERQRAQISQ